MASAWLIGSFAVVDVGPSLVGESPPLPPISVEGRLAVSTGSYVIPIKESAT